jgi:hypothetical protein
MAVAYSHSAKAWSLQKLKRSEEAISVREDMVHRFGRDNDTRIMKLVDLARKRLNELRASGPQAGQTLLSPDIDP